MTPTTAGKTLRDILNSCDAEFDKEFPYKIMAVIDNFGDPTKTDIKAHIHKRERAIIEAVVEEISKGKKNLVTENSPDAPCNPRCHDSGRESALDNLRSSLLSALEGSDNK